MCADKCLCIILGDSSWFLYQECLKRSFIHHSRPFVSATDTATVHSLMSSWSSGEIKLCPQNVLLSEVKTWDFFVLLKMKMSFGVVYSPLY